ncbi:MAG: lipopolysaccharide assembly protein LapA domain-containing protein [Verrucomicrobiota bacterium]
MVKFKLIAALVFATIIAIIIFQNTEPVETRLLFFTVTTPRAALLAFAALLGFGLGIIASLLVTRRAAKKEKDLEIK